MSTSPVQAQAVQIDAGGVVLEGNLSMPTGANGWVIFVHGSGSSRRSPRNQFVARALNEGGLATLLFDLLTAGEEELDLRTRELRFDIELLARRTVGATDWLLRQPQAASGKIGYFGASTGAAAGLIAAAERAQTARAVVSRGGRPDLAGPALPKVRAPVLFIVGELDRVVIDLNNEALAQMSPHTEAKLEIIPGATHLFEEPGTLEQAAGKASDWFQRHLQGAS